MGGASRQSDFTVVAAPVGDSGKAQTLHDAAAPELLDQLMTIQLAFEEFLKEGKAVMRRHGGKAEAGPRFSRAFNDKRARFGVYPVAVSPYPAAVCVDEGIREGFEHLVCPQPDVFVAAQARIGLEPSGVQPGPAVHSVAGHDEIHLR